LRNRSEGENWRALQNKPDILFENERMVSILETRNFGRLAFVEVGAMSVGRIVQVHPADAPFQRGEEKSFFRFGGSGSSRSASRVRGAPSMPCLSTPSREWRLSRHWVTSREM
jgi:phosphatidylserine decarboxylase